MGLWAQCRGPRASGCLKEFGRWDRAAEQRSCVLWTGAPGCRLAKLVSPCQVGFVHTSQPGRTAPHEWLILLCCPVPTASRGKAAPCPPGHAAPPSCRPGQRASAAAQHAGRSTQPLPPLVCPSLLLSGSLSSFSMLTKPLHAPHAHTCPYTPLQAPSCWPSFMLSPCLGCN